MGIIFSHLPRYAARQPFSSSDLFAAIPSRWSRGILERHRWNRWTGFKLKLSGNQEIHRKLPELFTVHEPFQPFGKIRQFPIIPGILQISCQFLGFPVGPFPNVVSVVRSLQEGMEQIGVGTEGLFGLLFRKCCFLGLEQGKGPFKEENGIAHVIREVLGKPIEISLCPGIIPQLYIKGRGEVAEAPTVIVETAPFSFVRGKLFFDLGDFSLYAFGLFWGHGVWIGPVCTKLMEIFWGMCRTTAYKLGAQFRFLL